MSGSSLNEQAANLVNKALQNRYRLTCDEAIEALEAAENLKSLRGWIDPHALPQYSPEELRWARAVARVGFRTSDSSLTADKAEKLIPQIHFLLAKKTSLHGASRVRAPSSLSAERAWIEANGYC
jgi:hypothetical protein